MKNNIIRTILIITFISFNYLAFSQRIKKENYTLTIIKEKITLENEQKVLIIPITFTNNTKNLLKYYSMSCSWEDFYSVDNKELQVNRQDCDKNIPIILTLTPGESKIVEIKLLMSKIIDTSEIKFKIGFNLMKVSSSKKEFDFYEHLKKKNIIWSKEINLSRGN